MKKTFVISLGGSIVAPKDGIDIEFLKEFKKLVLKQTKKGHRFFIIIGGGAICRKYNEAAKKMVKASEEELNWMGIHATWLNAYLVKIIFGKYAYEKIIKNPTLDIRTNKKILVGGGWKPGGTTDFAATKLAEKNKAKTVINLSNIDYVYTADPKKYKNAKKIEKINWKDFGKIVGDDCDPSVHTPFDSVATRLAQKLGLTVIIANGKNLKNLENCLSGKKFKGTTIKD